MSLIEFLPASMSCCAVNLDEQDEPAVPPLSVTAALGLKLDKTQ